MKKIFLPLLFLLSGISASAQEKMSCCSPNATEDFARLASDPAFVRSHAEPLPFRYRSQNGKDIVFKATDGTDAYGWEIKAKTPSRNYLFVIHEWWGLNDYIRREAENLWNSFPGLTVIAIDLYDKKVAGTREEAAKYVRAVTTERAEAIIKGALAYAGPQAKIYTIGWCFGGGWSLQASLLAGNQAAGCIMYYGMPEKNMAKLQALRADVLGIFGNKDQYINTKLVEEFAGNMAAAGKKLILKRYEADHGFANPSNPAFDKQSREEAWKNTMAFLEERIK
jgi:carboxymethylenebutenolidase